MTNINLQSWGTVTIQQEYTTASVNMTQDGSMVQVSVVQGTPLSVGIISGGTLLQSLNSLSDVRLTNPQDDDILIYNNNAFINIPKQNLVDGGNF